MTKREVLSRIAEVGIVPALRLHAAEDASFAAEALADGGIPVVEIPLTVPDAAEVIDDLAKRRPEIVAGAGSVFDLQAAQRCLDAGAAFLTSPGLDLEIIEFGLKHGIAVLPGALTPTEVMMASKAGGDLVKIFPCAQVGGPHYIKALKAPFPDVPLMASGGVNQQTVADFFIAGASAVGVGANLIQPEAIHRREPGWLKQLAQRYLGLVKQGRDRRKSFVMA
ncbi:MAG TPA: bifunctional 4-hydroxy-2-oxoglutarate aldolase/2-dehydro-3-deoxy-phosphogluconate aldolase [Bryobacteraceae bacterium]|nr:bifunctional 4-hydroxy-2-oxoglutarate aldolase/2-dehydro-3-deoxy-phosphogluconate aldolase [Bryobacteraceae bacterium]